MDDTDHTDDPADEASEAVVAPGADALVLATVFPEPHEIFAFQTLDKIIGDALFVLDTSALLKPFGVRNAARTRIKVEARARR